MSWGTTETRRQYVKYDVRSKSYLTPEQSRWEACWKNTFANLPLPVLRMIGSIAYRHAG
jgi:hypothetical protein